MLCFVFDSRSSSATAPHQPKLHAGCLCSAKRSSITFSHFNKILNSYPNDPYVFRSYCSSLACTRNKR